jgi:lysophospholipase L1-like esterase
MSARGRFLSVLVSIVVALAGFVTVGVLPAAAAPSAVQYVALGDSYAAGTAVGSFPTCPHNPDGYPALLDSEQSIHLRANATCSGATTSSVADTQLSALKPGTKLVTLTVGAADLGLSAVLTVCSDPVRTLDCLAVIQNVREVLLPALGGDLTDLYAEVADAAPKALIVVTGYPHLFEPVNPLSAEINAAIDQLNATIQRAVDTADAADTTDDNIVYVDVTEAFAEHGIFSADPFINATGLEAFHPNVLGYQAYADAILAELDEEAQLL